MMGLNEASDVDRKTFWNGLSIEGELYKLFCFLLAFVNRYCCSVSLHRKNKTRSCKNS